MLASVALMLAASFFTIMTRPRGGCGAAYFSVKGLADAPGKPL
jgi:hypothetical protein